MKILVAGAIALAAVAVVPPAVAREVRQAGIGIEQPWTRPTPPAAPAGAGYLTITNSGAAPDRLLGGSSPDVREVQVHQMTFSGGIMRMRPVAGGLVVPARGAVTLGPGGYHLMLIGPKTSFRAGGHIPVTLRFERAGEVKVSFDVRETPPTPADGAAR